MKYGILMTLLLVGLFSAKAQNEDAQNFEVPEISFDAQGKIVLRPVPGSSKEDFNFLHGKFSIRNKKIKAIFSNSDEWVEFDATLEVYGALHGLASVEKYVAIRDGKAFEGMSIKLFNPKTKLWSLHWADSNRGKFDPPPTGYFENKIGYFFTQEIMDGQRVIVVFRWDWTDRNHPVWSQAFSNDSGKTWEWNWYMYMTRVE